ncbi:MAG: IS21 family transposase [Actinomycetota bacterium]
MLAPEEDMEINALRKQGWSISAIARHLERDRKTIRAYLNGERESGVRAKPDEFVDAFDRFEPYVRQRLADDPHVWATVLFDEVVALGFDRSYQRFTHAVRERELRPHCEACAGVKGRATVEIEHAPGAEMQWDWLELPDTPWGAPTNLLVGALSHSSKTRGWFSESQDQPHLIEGIHEVLVRHGGTPKRWRVDRMSTVIVVGSDRVQPSFVPVAKHYGVRVDPCPPRRGNRKGVVEKNIDFLTQRWWRTARVNSPTEAQASLDEFCARIGDARDRDGMTVGERAAAEPLMGLPPLPFPATTTVERVVAANALVHYEGNRYSVPPGFVDKIVSVRWRLGADRIEVVAPSGQVIVEHRRAPKGAGRTIRLPEHTTALENVVLGAFTTDRPCKTKLNRPPSDAALALAAEITGAAGRSPVIDLSVYQRVIEEQGGRR